MYILAQPYKCVKCGFEFNYSPHEQHPAPVIESDQSGYLPVCPNCYTDWIHKNLGLGYCTVHWASKSGSAYDIAKAKQEK